jgi:hypothetical protein
MSHSPPIPAGSNSTVTAWLPHWAPQGKSTGTWEKTHRARGSALLVTAQSVALRQASPRVHGEEDSGRNIVPGGSGRKVCSERS